MPKFQPLAAPISTALLAAMFSLVAAHSNAGNATTAPKLKVDDNSFKCITEMTPVREFYVDNLLGNLTGTVAVATAGRGEYPEGSVVQLVPNEVMIKHEKGFSSATRDWEFF